MQHFATQIIFFIDYLGSIMTTTRKGDGSFQALFIAETLIIMLVYVWITAILSVQSIILLLSFYWDSCLFFKIQHGCIDAPTKERKFDTVCQI